VWIFWQFRIAIIRSPKSQHFNPLDKFWSLCKLENSSWGVKTSVSCLFFGSKISRLKIIKHENLHRQVKCSVCPSYVAERSFMCVVCTKCDSVCGNCLACDRKQTILNKQTNVGCSATSLYRISLDWLCVHISWVT